MSHECKHKKVPLKSRLKGDHVHLELCIDLIEKFAPYFLIIFVLVAQVGYVCTFIVPLLMSAYEHSYFFNKDYQVIYGATFISIEAFLFQIGVISLSRAICSSPGFVSEEWKQKIIDIGSKHWSEYTLR